jgi:hypothetical protein
MAIKFNRSQTFSTNGTVTAAGLHNLIDGTDIYQALITDQPSLTAVDPADSILIADASLTAGDAPRQTTVSNLFDDALTGGTYTNLNLTGALTFGTATGNRTVSTSATITTGTIPNLTAGTTTSTAATITTGTIATLTAGTTTGTAGIFTSGTVATLNSTTGTIGNLSTTLAGDFTISQGTGTIGTTGATLGTYGGATSVPVLAINAKGQVTSTGTAAITSGFTGFRNRIINGDMRIDQRNAGASYTQVNALYNLDRWAGNTFDGGAAVNKFSVIQSSTAPTGFSKSLLVTSLATTASGASNIFNIEHKIEGFNFADFLYGTASAQTLTLSFWVRSSLTGTFGGALKNSARDRAYPFTYTISTANTFEQKTITITGDTSGTWVGGTNGIGLWISFGLGVGSTYSGTAGAWGAGDIFSATGATSVVGTNGATFYITGVQLEAGSTATDFERRPYGTELALCQRYYEKSYNIDVVPATSTALGALSLSQFTNELVGFKFVTTKRSQPTVTLYATSGNINQLDGNTNTATAQYIGTSAVGYISRTATSGSYYFGHFTASSEL